MTTRGLKQPKPRDSADEASHDARVTAARQTVERGVRAERWDRRRTRSIRRIRLLGLGLLGAVTLPLLLYVGLQPWVGRKSVEEFVVKVIGGFGVFGNALETFFGGAFHGFAARWPVAFAALAGWLLATLGGAAAARAIHERAFAEFDDGRLHPIAAPESGIVDVVDALHPKHRRQRSPMPFQRPAGAWTRTWLELRRLVEHGVGTDRVPWWKPLGTPHVPVPFAYVLLLGRPGAGKTRMVRELARELGRRDVLGSTAPSDRRRYGERLRRGAWWRRAAWFLDRDPHDPWDSGEIDQSDPSVLDDWRPRRPTLLLLDDPGTDSATHYIARLRANERSFRHPVRLVITSQTTPSDVESKARVGMLPSGSLTLRAGAFGRLEIVTLAPAMLHESRDKVRTSKDLDLFLDVTDGNPFVTELAFDWLRQGNELESMSREKVYDLRIANILEALDVAQFPTGNVEALRALACGTLVGPGCRIGPVDEAFGRTLPSLLVLERAFPVEAEAKFDFSRLLPCIRPEMIGDHFVRAVISQREPEETARRMCDAGFRAHPDGWLRAVERLAGGRDVLAGALAVEPPIAPDDVATRQVVAQAYMRLGLRLLREPAEICRRLDRLIGDVSDDAARVELARTLLAWFHEEIDDDWARRNASIVRHAQHQTASTSGSGDDERYTPVDRFHLFFHGKSIALLGATLLRHTYVTRGELVSGTLIDAIGRLRAVFEPRCDFSWREVDGDLFTTEIANLIDARTDDVRVRATVLSAACDLAVSRLTLSSIIAVCRNGVSRVEAIASTDSLAADADIQRARAAAWRCLAYALVSDPAGCREAVMHVETIASANAFAPDASIQHERASAWQILAYALNWDPAASRAAVAKVEAIASADAFAADASIQRERADAWRNLSYALRADAAGCREAVERVRAIARRFPDDDAIQRELATAQSFLA